MRPRLGLVMADYYDKSQTKIPTSPRDNKNANGLHNSVRFIGNESDDTTKTAQAISFTTPPTSLIFRLRSSISVCHEVGEPSNQNSLGLC